MTATCWRVDEHGETLEDSGEFTSADPWDALVPNVRALALVMLAREAYAYRVSRVEAAIDALCIAHDAVEAARREAIIARDELEETGQTLTDAMYHYARVKGSRV